MATPAQIKAAIVREIDSERAILNVQIDACAAIVAAGTLARLQAAENLLAYLNNGRKTPSL